MTGDSGRMEDGEHVLPIRIYYEDTDAGGIVYYAAYLRFAERARTELLRLAGVSQSVLARDHGLGFAVRHCAVDYRAPARLDDLIEVRSRLSALGGASLEARQVIRRQAADLARLDVRLACLGRDGRPARLPEALRRVLKPYCHRAERDR